MTRKPLFLRHVLALNIFVFCFVLLTRTARGQDPGIIEQAAYIPGLERSSVEAKCGGGGPCVFVNRDVGWVEYIPTTDPRNAHKPKPVPPAAGSYSWGAAAAEGGEGEGTPQADAEKPGAPPPPPRLVISISSFRDKLCPITLTNIYTKADHPEWVVVQVVQQNVHGEDPDCVDEYCAMMKRRSEQAVHSGSGSGSGAFTCPYLDNIRIMRVDAGEAKGPQWARALGSHMLRNTFRAAQTGQLSGAWKDIDPTSSFCMQMDAHMDMVQGFDRLMISTWAAAKNEMAVLSTYVASTDELRVSGEHDRGLNNLHEVPLLCMLTLHGANDLPRNWGTKCARMLPEPKLTNAVWGAGLSFSRCHAEIKVPYDPHLPFIFDGEEFSRAVRFFTWGYDVYTPHRVYILHNYHGSQADPLHNQWGNPQRATTDKDKGKDKGTDAAALRPYDAVPSLLVSDKTGAYSTERIKQLLEMADRKSKDPAAARLVQRGLYGLGDRRTLDQAIAFSGVNTKTRHIDANRCGNIDWVPYVPHPLGPAYVPVYDAATEAFADKRDAGSVFQDDGVGVGVGGGIAVGLESNQAAAAAAAAAAGREEEDLMALQKQQRVRLAVQAPPASASAQTRPGRAPPRTQPTRTGVSLRGLEYVLGADSAVVRSLQALLLSHAYASPDEGSGGIGKSAQGAGAGAGAGAVQTVNIATVQHEIDAILSIVVLIACGTAWLVWRRYSPAGKAYGIVLQQQQQQQQGGLAVQAQQAPRDHPGHKGE